MPIYEYYCPKCDEEFELVHSINTKKTKCPECGAKIKRLISQNAFHLKGGGWYREGYDSTRKKPAKSADESGAKKEKPSKKSEAAA